MLDSPQQTAARIWLDKDDERWQRRDQSIYPLGNAAPCALRQHEYDPQWLDLAWQVSRESQELYHWEMVVKELRASWSVQNRNATPTDRDFIQYQPKHLAVFREVVGSIGRSIGRALREKRKHEAEIERLRGLMDEIERQHPSAGPTNREMAACLDESRARKEAAIERDGCCGGEPMQDGFCFGIGPCPRVQEIKQATAFCESYLRWLDDESALAEITARLSSVPLFGETTE